MHTVSHTDSLINGVRLMHPWLMEPEQYKKSSERSERDIYFTVISIITSICLMVPG